MAEALWARATLAAALMPGMVAGVIPAWLLRRSPGPTLPLGTLHWLGIPVALTGLGVLLVTIVAFATRGHGTLAPWDAPTTLVHLPWALAHSAAWVLGPWWPLAHADNLRMLRQGHRADASTWLRFWGQTPTAPLAAHVVGSAPAFNA